MLQANPLLRKYQVEEVDPPAQNHSRPNSTCGQPVFVQQLQQLLVWQGGRDCNQMARWLLLQGQRMREHLQGHTQERHEVTPSSDGQSAPEASYRLSFLLQLTAETIAALSS